MYTNEDTIKNKYMKIITTREFRNETRNFFELAEKQRVSVKRGNKYVNLIVSENPDTNYVSEEWIEEFMAIPAEFRCNPFETSPSGDLFFADKRNIDQLNKSIKQAKSGQKRTLSRKEQQDLFNI